MKRISTPNDSRTFMAIARLRNHDDFKSLMETLRASNQQIDKRLRSRQNDVENHYDAGAGQAIDELVELFENAEEWGNKTYSRELSAGRKEK